MRKLRVTFCNWQMKRVGSGGMMMLCRGAPLEEWKEARQVCVKLLARHGQVLDAKHQLSFSS
jgi:hypothetical protein